MSEDGPSAVRAAARTHARDRYLAALLAPAAARDDLITLAAYLGEVQRIPLVAHEAHIGEIRLQWWRDALSARAPASGHPVADAVVEMVGRRRLPHELLLAPLEGRSRELYEDGIPDQAALEAYAHETEGAPLLLALAVLGADVSGLDAASREGPVREGPVGEGPVREAARTLALTHLALALPYHLALGRLPLPQAMIIAEGDPRGMAEDAAREAVRRLDTHLTADAFAALARFRALQAQEKGRLSPAFLPLSLVQPYLRAVAAPQRDALREPADISPLSRVARLWFARWRGAV